MEEGCTVDGKTGRQRKAGFIPPFLGAPVPASHQAQAEEFLFAVSDFIPGVSANHESRYTNRVASYLYDMDQHPTVEVVKRPSNRPRKPEMLQLFIRVEDEKAWKSGKVWDSDSVFSM
jgi:nucleoid-associated protein YejK